jgi:hypothetical protein
MLLALAVLHALVLWRMAIVSGYLSERHTMLLAFLACFWCGAAVVEIGERLKRRSWLVPIAAVTFLALGLPSTLKPMHASRAGHRQAGTWMASNVSEQDEVVDPFCWAHFYAGCVFREGKDQLAPKNQRVRFVVLEQSETAHSRLPLIISARELAKTGTCVYHWPENQPPEKARVVVYRVAPAAIADGLARK